MPQSPSFHEFERELYKLTAPQRSGEAMRQLYWLCTTSILAVLAESLPAFFGLLIGAPVAGWLLSLYLPFALVIFWAKFVHELAYALVLGAAPAVALFLYFHGPGNELWTPLLIAIPIGVANVIGMLGLTLGLGYLAGFRTLKAILFH